MHPSAVRALRGRREGDLGDTGDLGGDDVHDDARGVDGLAAGHVEPDPPYRLPPLQHAGARAEFGHRWRGHLRGGCPPDARDRLLERRPHLRIERRRAPRRGGRPARGCRDRPTPSNRSACSRSAASPRAATSATRVGRSGERLFAGGGGARHDGQEFCRREGATAQIDRAEHLFTLSRWAAAAQMDGDRGCDAEERTGPRSVRTPPEKDPRPRTRAQGRMTGSRVLAKHGSDARVACRSTGRRPRSEVARRRTGRRTT